MRSLPRLPLVLLLMLGACHESTAPKTYNAGTWIDGFITPSGAYTEFSLDTVAGVVRGDGRHYAFSGIEDTFTITGYLAYPVIALRFTYSKGGTAVYTARFVSSLQMMGTWAVPGQAPRDSVTYNLEMSL